MRSGEQGRQRDNRLALYEDLERRWVPEKKMRACGEAIGAGLEHNDQIVLIRAREFDFFSK